MADFIANSFGFVAKTYTLLVFASGILAGYGIRSVVQKIRDRKKD